MYKYKSFLSLLVSIYLVFNTLSAFSQTAKAVSEITVTVSDIHKVLPFYTKILPFKVLDTFSIDAKSAAMLYNLPIANARVKMLRLGLGNQTFVLQEFPDHKNNRLIPEDSKSNDLWFQHIAIVVSDMENAYEILRKNRVAHVSTAPQTLPDYITEAAGIKAFYFKDPDGHNLEIIYFPSGKGNPKWQRNNLQLFLGIDHSAIGISNTPRQQEFYELLGLKLVGKSENYGSEQEHLNQVFGARLEISGLMAQQGIGIEFLEYIAPPGGKNYPENSSATDLWHWHSSIEVNNLEELYQQLKNKDIEIISKEIVNLKNSKLNATRVLMIRDLDGHAILLFEK
ncbi:VOC family protein [Yeosuana sp. AK3]